MKIIATIIWGIDDKEWNASRKAEVWKLIQVMATKELKPLVGSTMTFSPEDMYPLQTSHSDGLVDITQDSNCHGSPNTYQHWKFY